jgi:uncharacterized caspase-like protein
MAGKFREKYGEACQIDTLFDEEVTPEKVKALKAGLMKTGVNDKVILAYSGHGLLSSNYDYYLSAYNINFAKPEEGGISYEILEDLIDSIPARQKLMLIDACHSGEVDKEDAGTASGIGSILSKAKADARERKLGLKNSFELMRDLFVNVGAGTGTTVIAAAGGRQYAQEQGDLKAGVFTYSILEYMNNQPHATVAALRNQVNRRVTELTHGQQVPTARAENNIADWMVW